MFVLADKDSANYYIKSSDLTANILGTLPTDVSTNTSNISLNTTAISNNFALINTNIGHISDLAGAPFLTFESSTILNAERVFIPGSGLSGDVGAFSEYDLRVDPNRAELVSAQGGDFILIADADDSYNVKKVRADSIAGIGDLTDVVFTSGQQLITGLKIFKSGASFSGYGTSPYNGDPFRPAMLVTGYVGITGGDVDISGNTTIGTYEDPNFFYAGTGRDGYHKIGIGGFTDAKLSSIGYPDGDISISGMVHMSGGNVIIEGPSPNPANLFVSGDIYVSGAGGWVKVGAGGGSTSPDGSDTQIQYNNGGDFGASPNLTFDGSSLEIEGNDIYQKSEHNSLSNASNFRLEDYVLQTSMTGIPKPVAEECSAITYNPSGSTYLALCPHTTADNHIHEYKFGGELVRSTAFNTPGIPYGDVEGFCYVTGNTFALCSERMQQSILLFDYIGNANLGGTIPSTDFTVYDVTLSPTPGSNQGLEGISYNPEKNVFYGITEGDTEAWRVYEITLGSAPTTSVTELFNALEVPEKNDKSISWGVDQPDRVSDIYYDPNSKHLFITDHGDVASGSTHSKVWECDLEGNLINVRDVKDSFGVKYNQIEGITFSPDGSRMVVAGECDGDGSDLGFYAISSNAVDGAYINPAILATDDYITSDHTFTYEDAGKYMHVSGASDVTITLPSGDYNRFNGLQFEVFNESASHVVNVSGANGVPLKAKGFGPPGSPANVAEIPLGYRWAKFWNIRGTWYGAGDID
jgi:uncharacterized protein YjiK